MVTVGGTLISIGGIVLAFVRGMYPPSGGTIPEGRMFPKEV